MKEIKTGTERHYECPQYAAISAMAERQISRIGDMPPFFIFLEPKYIASSTNVRIRGRIINDLLINDLTLFSIVQLELLGMVEVLKDFSVFVCDCDSHGYCAQGKRKCALVCIVSIWNG